MVHSGNRWRCGSTRVLMGRVFGAATPERPRRFASCTLRASAMHGAKMASPPQKQNQTREIGGMGVSDLSFRYSRGQYL